MTKQILWDLSDLGCYADGGFGHDNVRQKLAMLLEDIDRALPPFDTASLRAELAGPCSDDFAEEDEALDILNAHSSDHVLWGMSGGDLVLRQSEDENDD